MALKRFGDKATPQDIMRSIKERSVSDEELGMFWRDAGAVVVVVPGADRDAGDDDRGVRRGAERRGGGRGLQGLAAEAEADAGLEDDQGHGRRGLRPAAARQPAAGLRRAGRSGAGRPGDQAGEGRGRHGLLRAAVRRRRDQAGDGPDHGEEGRRGRGLGQRPLAVPGGHEQGDAVRGHAAEAAEGAVHQAEHEEGPGAGAGAGPVQRGRRAGGADRDLRSTATWSTCT